MKNILITGGAGFIGSHVAEEFAREDWRVTALDNLGRSKLFGDKGKSVEHNWKFLASIQNVRCIKVDIRNAGALFSIFKRTQFDFVVHAAAQPGVRKSLEDPREDFEINALGSFNILEALRRTNPKAALVYLSTNKVYGENVKQFKLVEKKTRYEFKSIKGVNESLPTDLTGHTPYGVSKFTGDLYTQDYATSFGLRTAVFRMSCIYGPRQFGFEDQGWLAWFMISARRRRPVFIYGNGKQVRDALYVKDLVQAMKLFFHSKIRQGVWNIGGGTRHTISLLELVKRIEALTGERMKLKYRSWRPSDQRVYVSDITKARRELHWQPKIDLEEGTLRLWRWIRENQNLFS